MPNEQMYVSVTAALARYVRGRVKTGLNGDASEVICEALKALKRQEELQQQSTGDLVLTPKEEAAAHLAVRAGLDDIRQGRYRVLDANGLNKLGRDLVTRTAKKRHLRT